MRWYALRCQAGGEFRTMDALCRTGVFAFAPVEYRRRLVGRRRRPAQARTALLPGYVLAKLRHGYAAHGCPLVRGVVCMGDEPIPVSDMAVWALMQRSGRVDRRTA